MYIENRDYKIKQLSGKIQIKEYLEACVNTEEFLEYCKTCSNYGKVWSCPPYDFSVEQYWKNYKTLLLYGKKIIFSREMLEREYTQQEVDKVLREILVREKEKMTEELYRMENENEGSVSLRAGSCTRCCKEGCTREQGDKCRHINDLRYSIESLGGNVGLTIRKYLREELLWMEENKLPEYFILIGGLLLK